MSAIVAHLAEWMPELAGGMAATLRLMVLSFLVAGVLGLPIALARLAANRVLRATARCYVEVVRGMPALTLLLLLYFALPSVGVSLGAATAAVVGLGLNGSAYMSEIYRAGIEAVDPGQREAALMVGLRRWQVLRRVVLPQAARIVLPPIGNFSISLLKATSVASLISAPELMLGARDLTSEYFMPLEIYALTGMLYLAMALPLSGCVRWLEARAAGPALPLLAKDIP